ncbi:MAG: hypothetical protein QHJ81_14630 [Anaerolineae bacterium]|nr:hypothetical protein [Anaerolineae bacterium]
MSTGLPLYRSRHVAVERRPNGRWRVGRAGAYGIADPAETIELRIGELSDSPYDQPEERKQCLKELAGQQGGEYGYLLALLVAELDEVIDHFHGPVPKSVSTPSEVMAVACQAALCRAWLDFLEGQAGFQIGPSAERSLWRLWRRYCRALSALYELAGDSEAMDTAAWKALSSWRDLEDEYRRALHCWSRILLNPDNEATIANVLSEGGENPATLMEREPLARRWEQEVADLIWLPQGGLRRFFRGQPDGPRFLDRLARGWFLPRYDLPNISRLIGDQIDAAGGPRWLGWMYRSWSRMPGLWVELSALLLMAGAWLGSASQAQEGFLRTLCIVLVVLGGAGALLGVAGVLSGMWRLGRRALYPFSVRLAAGTFAGLVVLSGLSDHLADYMFKAFCTTGQSCRYVGSVLLLVISGVAALVYMFSDALSQINDRRLACQRAVRLFLFGWAQSTLFAAATSWLAANRVIPTQLAGTSAPCRVLHLWAGDLYPDYLVSAGVLALVVGVLTQILWEDRPIPEPL